MSEPEPRVIYEFSGFRADPLKRRLYLGDEPLQITPKAFETLLVLIANRGNIVSKSELMEGVWAETAVEENNLTQQISFLRKTFGEKAGEHRFIVTMPGKGYSFVAPVAETEIFEGDEYLLVRSTRSTFSLDIGTGLIAYLRQIFGRAFVRDGTLGASIAVWYIAMIIGLLTFVPMLNGGHAGRHPQTVAVLSFRTTDANDEALSVGIRDTLQARIGNLEDVQLRPVRDGLAPDDLVMAGRSIDADIIFSGSIQRNEGRVRVAVKMVDVNNEQIVWGQTFDYDDPRRFEAQDAIAIEVIRILGRSVSGKI